MPGIGRHDYNRHGRLYVLIADGIERNALQRFTKCLSKAWKSFFYLTEITIAC